MNDKLILDPLDIADAVIVGTQLGADFAPGTKGAAIAKLLAKVGTAALIATRRLANPDTELSDYRVPATLEEHVQQVLARLGIELDEAA